MGKLILALVLFGDPYHMDHNNLHDDDIKSLREALVEMNVMDADRTHCYFRKGVDVWESEVRLVRNAYESRDSWVQSQKIPENDSQRFVVCPFYLDKITTFYYNHQQHLNHLEVCYPHKKDDIEAARREIKELSVLCEAYKSVKSNYVGDRLDGLRKLRKLIDEEAYWNGYVPSFVPSYFTEEK